MYIIPLNKTQGDGVKINFFGVRGSIPFNIGLPGTRIFYQDVKPGDVVIRKRLQNNFGSSIPPKGFGVFRRL